MTQHHGSTDLTSGGASLPGSTILEAPDGAGDDLCDVCPHPWTAHDAIGARFCRATRSSGSASERGCVCRK